MKQSASGTTQPLGVAQTGDVSSQTVGKTADRTCCPCTHPECSTFKKKGLCERLFFIQVYYGIDFYGGPYDGRAGEAAVKATLSTRSYRACRFPEKSGGISMRKDVVTVVVLLAEGEPPLTNKDVMGWNTELTSVRMMRSGCCMRAHYHSVSQVVHHYFRDVKGVDQGSDGIASVSSQSMISDLVQSCVDMSLGGREGDSTQESKTGSWCFPYCVICKEWSGFWSEVRKRRRDATGNERGSVVVKETV